MKEPRDQQPSPDDEVLGPDEKWIQDLIDQEDQDASWFPPEDGLPYLLAFQHAIRTRTEVPEDVLRWVYLGFSEFYASGGKEDLARSLGLRGAAKRISRFHRELSDDQLLFQMDMLVFIGMEIEDAASILEHYFGADRKGPTYDTILRKYGTRRERLSPELLRVVLESTDEDADGYLARFAGRPYSIKQLLSMKRKG